MHYVAPPLVLHPSFDEVVWWFSMYIYFKLLNTLIDRAVHALLRDALRSGFSDIFQKCLKASLRQFLHREEIASRLPWGNFSCIGATYVAPPLVVHPSFDEVVCWFSMYFYFKLLNTLIDRAVHALLRDALRSGFSDIFQKCLKASLRQFLHREEIASRLPWGNFSCIGAT